jgi:hypothetical protein
MTTIKSYTDIEQSKKLAKILPLESADMRYAPFRDTHPWVWSEQVKLLENGAIPCWSLAALLNILDYPQLSKDKLGSGKVGWMVSAYPNDCRYDSCWHDNPIDACYELISNLY